MKQINGIIVFRVNGKLHREDGPAVIFPDGSTRYYQNGVYHRKNGPAIELLNGTKKYYRNGKLHREAGPAIELPNGTKEYWLNDEQYELKEFYEKTGSVTFMIEKTEYRFICGDNN